MPKPLTRRLAPVLALIVLAAGFAAPGRAQQETALRVRGTIAAIAGDRLTIKSADGKILRITLTPDAHVLAIVPARLADIKPGRFVGTAARPDGDKWRAIEVHIFPPGSRLGEGHRPWDPEPGATMTNADVSAALVRAGKGELTLSTGGRRYVIEVPRGTPVVAMNPGTRRLVRKGAYVSLTRVTQENGILTANSIAVSKDRRWPPK